MKNSACRTRKLYFRLAVLFLIGWSLLTINNVRLLEKQTRTTVNHQVAGTGKTVFDQNQSVLPPETKPPAKIKYRPTSKASDATLPSQASRNVMRRPRRQPFPRVKRFPQRGTLQFETECGWLTNPRSNVTAVSQQQLSFPCTFLVRPLPTTGEGIADWIARVVSGYLLAKQTGCQLLYDYGPKVNLSQIFLASSDPQASWEFPFDFVCSESSDRPCFKSGSANQGLDFSKEDAIASIAARLNQTVFPVPFYRHMSIMVIKSFRELEETLPGFTLRNGMGCALSHLFPLAPSVAQVEPRFFDILSELRQERANSTSLVLAMYVRTHYTDRMVHTRNQSALEDMDAYMELAQKSIQCALKVEKEYLKDGKTQNILWMLLTDSPGLKKRVAEDYNQQALPERDKSNEVDSRRLLVTTSRGHHSRGALQPSTTDFAEALLDWYLIGESDLVVTTTSTTFGLEAAARTGRPTFRSEGCVNLLGNWEN